MAAATETTVELRATETTALTSDTSNVTIEVPSNQELLKALETSVLETVEKQLEEQVFKFTESKDMVRVLHIIMEAIEDRELKGSMQKEIAVHILTTLIGKSELSDENKKFALHMVHSGTVESTIELIVAASRGNINVNHAVNLATQSCISSCLGYFVAHSSANK
jgi:hypothetical protein|tara:strand:- start:2372 stop:2866 length:495 start_codon:yes stop_codon:yes gene_type:complete